MSNQTDNPAEHVFLGDRIKRIKKPIMILVWGTVGLSFAAGMLQQYF